MVDTAFLTSEIIQGKMTEAARDGDFKLFKEAYDSHPFNDRHEPDEAEPIFPWHPEMFSYAAEGGNFDLLNWLHAQNCPLTTVACQYAALKGNLKVLQWLRAKKCPWDEWTCAYTALGSHRETIEWARNHGAPWDWRTLAYAIQRDDSELVQWLHEHDCPRREENCTEVYDWRTRKWSLAPTSSRQQGIADCRPAVGEK